MAMSKVKSNKQKARLKARQEAWEKLPSDLKTSSSGRPAFTKPGSNRK